VDAELVTRAQNGDRDAMDALLMDVRSLVMRRCARVLPYPQDAEEAAQDALLSIALKLKTYSGRGSFEGWVGAIATNQARMTYRTLKRRFNERSDVDMPESADPARTSVIAGTRLDLLDALELLEQRNLAEAEAFVLRDLGALPYEDIAEMTGVPLGTVKARIHRAREFMRAELGQ
jgi:RNA polymerase sigma-70 factor (ECF subfamily)